MQILSAEYEKILAQASELLSGEKDLVANAANVTAMLFEALEAVDWVGIYFLRNGELILGPFQGRTVNPRVSLGRSAAGRVVRDLRSLITEGRVAEDLDDLSQAQVIVPILLHQRCVGVLEVDSPFAGRFNDNDRAGLESIAHLLIKTSDTAPLLPKRASLSELRAQPQAAEPKTKRPVVTQQVMPTVREELPAPDQPARRSRSGKGRIFVALTAAMLFACALTNVFALSPAPFVTSSDLLAHAGAKMLAFGVFGTAVGLAGRLRLRGVAGVSCAYALLLVCIQALTGVQTNMPAHLGDLVCGLVGGYLGGATARALRRRSPLRQRDAATHRL